MIVIYGLFIMVLVVCIWKCRFEDDEWQSIFSVFQGEVVRLDFKFLVNLDFFYCSNNGIVYLICKLDDKDFLSVLLLEFSVFVDYFV